MTWAHYQQLKQAAQQLIAERKAALQPQGGAGVSINGNSIALTPTPLFTSDQPPDEWEVVILGQIKGQQVNAGVNEESFTFPWEVAMRGYRDARGTEETGFWQKTSFFGLREDGEELQTRSFTLELQVRTVTGELLSPINDERLEELIYRFPLKLIVEEYERVERPGTTGPVFVENVVIDTHEITLRRRVESRVFTPSKLGLFYLRPVALLRVE